jgi:hypothetical protein
LYEFLCLAGCPQIDQHYNSPFARLDVLCLVICSEMLNYGGLYMYASILMLTLAAGQAPTTDGPSPDWKSDYAAASKECKAAHKPLAVFVGKGADGAAQVCDSGRFGPETRKLLADKYVCLYVDRATPAGQKLATDLELANDGPGLVISDSTGALQALRRKGQLTAGTLVEHLRTFSDPERVVTRTDTGEREDVRFYPSEGSGNFHQGFGFSSGGCPSCGR